MSELGKHIPDDPSYITISCPMKRITIRKKTLDVLGNPKFISFMMQDDGRAAIIKATSEDDDEKIHVTDSIDRKGVFQIGRTLLIGMIRERMNWNEKLSYRIPAKLIEDDMVLFDFDKAVPNAITQEKEELLEADTEDDNTSYYWQGTGQAVFQNASNARELIENDMSEADKKNEETPHIEIHGKVNDVYSVKNSEEVVEIDSTEKFNERHRYLVDSDFLIWAKNQLSSWGWSQDAIETWSTERKINADTAFRTFFAWRMGKMEQSDFYIHHKEIDLMDFAFEYGRRVSVVRRIRANMKAFNVTMMAIIYDESADVCEQILTFIKEKPYLSDFEIVLKVDWR